MQKLESRAPEVYEAFIDAQHSFPQSKEKFTGTAADQVLEQTLNKDGKSKGGIIGKSQCESAKSKWFLTAHVRGEMV